MNAFEVGAMVRVTAKGSRYFGHVGIIIDRADSGEWAVNLAGLPGRLYYRDDELVEVTA